MPLFNIVFSDGTVLATLPAPAANGLRFVNIDGTAISFFEDRSSSITLPALGSGHFGVVLRAVDSLGLQRAVKFIDQSRLPPKRPATSLPHLDSSGAKLLADLQSEIRTTNIRLFKHVVPVVACDAAQDVNGHLIPYTVSPFVDGPLLHHYFESLATETISSGLTWKLNALHDIFLDVVDDLLGALVEMEEAMVSHIDLKPSNIIVQRAASADLGVRDQAFVIDFAGAVSRRPLPVGSRVPLLNTPWFFPQGEIAHDCRRDSEGNADHSALVRWGPIIDRHCLGRTLETVIVDATRNNSNHLFDDTFRRVQDIKEKRWRAVLRHDYELVERLIARLQHADPIPFRSAADARLAFQAVARHSSSNVLTSEALTDRTRGIVINVGIMSVKIAPPFDRIVNHTALQRLRQLQQLSLISDVFPAATHSRFTHVLATFGLSKRYLLALVRDTVFRQLCTHNDVEHIMAAALLHDLGQYAFSHTIEDLKKIGDLCSIPSLGTIIHDQDLVAKYLDIPDQGVTIREILADSNIDVGRVLYMIEKTAKQDAMGPACSLGRDIVSGVIDVDRISYLLQDSATSGTSFGDSINIDELIDSLCVRQDGESVSLAIRESGVSSVEAVLAAVYWMYKNVYWHPLNRGMMVAIKHVFWDLLEHGGMAFGEYLDAIYGQSERYALRYLTERYELFIASRPGWRNPLKVMAEGGRSPMIRVWSTGRPQSSATDAEDLYGGIYRTLGRGFFKSVIDSVREDLPASVAPCRGEILIDVPMKKRIIESMRGTATTARETETEAGRREPLWVEIQSSNGQGRWKLLEEHTPLVRALAEAEDRNARKVRLFFSKNLLDRCKERGVGDLWTLADRSIRRVVGGAGASFCTATDGHSG